MLNCVNLVLGVKTQIIVGLIYTMCLTYAQSHPVCLRDFIVPFCRMYVIKLLVIEIKEEVKTILNSRNLLPLLFSNILSSIIIPIILVIIMYKIPILPPVLCIILN
jgi:hypothetical protein